MQPTTARSRNDIGRPSYIGIGLALQWALIGRAMVSGGPGPLFSFPIMSCFTMLIGRSMIAMPCLKFWRAISPAPGRPVLPLYLIARVALSIAYGRTAPLLP